MHIRSQPTPEGSTPPTGDDICDEMLDRRSNYIKGLGYVVVTPSSSRASHVSYDARLLEVQRRHEEEMHWAEKEHHRSKEDITALQCTNAQLTFQLETFGIRLDELYHHMPPLLTPDISVDTYDDDDGCPLVIDIILYYF